MKRYLFYLAAALMFAIVHLQAQKKENYQHTAGRSSSVVDTPQIKKVQPVFRLLHYSNNWRVPYPLDSLEEKRLKPLTY